ncbi:chitinase, partial [Streptomyces sp. NPDC001130]
MARLPAALSPAVLSLAAGLLTASPAQAATGADPSAPTAVAPYLYNGWGSPPDPTTITRATGVRWFT